MRAASIRAAHAQFQSEWQEANAGVSAAAAGVAAKVGAVVMCTAKRLTSEYIAAVETYMAYGDRLSGLQLFSRERQGRERLDELVGETLARTDRRKQARLADPQMIEDWKYQDLLIGHAKAEQARWQDYAARLAEDSGAQFEAPSGHGEQ